MKKQAWRGGSRHLIETRIALSGAVRNLAFWWDGADFAVGEPLGGGRADYYIKREELVEFAKSALGMMDESEVHRVQRGSHEIAEGLRQRAEAAEAKLARVREARCEFVRRQMTYRELTEILDAALADAPTFALPTTAGAGITATFSGGKWAGEETEYRLYSDGYWRNQHSGASDTPEHVMKYFANHRLIEEDGA